MNKGRTTILQKGKGKSRKKAKFEYLYEKESQYFAEVAENIKDIALKELENLGASDLQSVFRGIWFKASKKDFYRINYYSRLVSRILAPLIRFECHDKDELYNQVGRVFNP